MKFTVDRIEDDIAVLEDKNLKYHLVKISELPEGISDGDILMFSDGKYYKDKQGTSLRRKQMYKRYAALFGKNGE